VTAHAEALARLVEQGYTAEQARRIVAGLEAPPAVTVVDTDAIREKWLQLCGSCDAGLPMNCTHPDEDYRPVMATLVDEIERLRTAGGEQP
jgi:hypothetical protein